MKVKFVYHNKYMYKSRGIFIRCDVYGRNLLPRLIAKRKDTCTNKFAAHRLIINMRMISSKT